VPRCRGAVRRALPARLQQCLQPVVRVLAALQLPDSAEGEPAEHAHSRRRIVCRGGALSPAASAGLTPAMGAARDRAARAAVALVEPGMIVGLGTGDTARRFIE